MTDRPRDRAIRAALALLHQPGAAGASGAWRTVGELGRIGVQLRSASDEATTAGSFGTLATWGAARPAAEPWTAAARQLAERLEEAAAWGTAGSGFRWPDWDEASTAALGELLCELDALAAALLTAAGYDTAPSASAATGTFPPSVGAGGFPPPSGGADGPGGMHPADAMHLADAISRNGRRRPLRRRGSGGRLVPSIGLAAVAVVGVLGGITVAASGGAPAEVPRRAIVSEPVPYTLHDAEPTTPAGDGGGTGAGQAGVAASSAGVPRPSASAKPQSPDASPSASASASATASSAATGATPTPSQASKTPQPRDGGAPPSLAPTTPAPQQLGDVVADIRGQAEQVQEQQLRELARRMQAAMGLNPGVRTP